jgi:excisionase family DNA binding protein
MTTPETRQPPHEPRPSPWMTRADAATYARVSVASISRAIRAGRLRAYRIAGGRAVRLHRDDVDAWLRTHLTGVERVLRRGR